MKLNDKVKKQTKKQNLKCVINYHSVLTVKLIS